MRELLRPDEGLRAGRHFWFAAHDVASLLIGESKALAIQPTIADVRREAVRYRPKTRSHLPDPDAEPDVDAADLVEPDWPKLPLDELEPNDMAADLDEPDWMTGLPPTDSFPERRFRGWGERIRIERGELALADHLPTLAEMVDDERFLSRSFALGTQYVDVFGPAVCAPHKREIWPDGPGLSRLPPTAGLPRLRHERVLDRGVGDRRCRREAPTRGGSRQPGDPVVSRCRSTLKVW